MYGTGKMSVIQESPPAWTQEAHRPPRSKSSLCCSVSWWRGGYPIQPWMGGGIPSSLGLGVPHPVLEGVPYLVLDGGVPQGTPPSAGRAPPSIPGMGYLHHPPHPDLGWGTPHPDLVWGIPPHQQDGVTPSTHTWDGPPPPPVWTWDGPPPENITFLILRMRAVITSWNQRNLNKSASD